MARRKGGGVMIKIDSVGAIYCLSCSSQIEGVIVGVEDRPDLIGESCVECEMGVI